MIDKKVIVIINKILFVIFPTSLTLSLSCNRTETIHYTTKHPIQIASKPNIVNLNTEVPGVSLKGYTPFKDLTPFKDNGPGVLVCDPVINNKKLLAFSKGCGLWLHVTVAGNPKFGQSVSYMSNKRVMNELNRNDFALTLNDIKQLKSILGITHVAIGSLIGSHDHCQLNYQIYSLTDMSKIGTTVSYSGTSTQVANALPSVAVNLIKLLGGEPKEASFIPPLNKDQYEFIGNVKLLPDSWSLSRSDEIKLKNMAYDSPIPALVNFELRYYGNRYLTDISDRIINSIPSHNSIIAEMVAYETNKSKSIETACLIYPHNSLLNRAMYLGSNASNQRQYVENLVRSAPNNPSSWLVLSGLIYNEADAIRHGRFYNKMTTAEQQYVSQIYPEWVIYTRHATELDPLYGDAWLEYTKACCFSSEGSPNLYYNKAFKLVYLKAPIYGWGLQMYQPKWLDNPTMLTKVAKTAVTDKYIYFNDVINVTSTLLEQNHQSEAKALMTRYMPSVYRKIKQNPNDGHGYWQLALCHKAINNDIEALKQFRKSQQLISDDPDLCFHTAKLLDKMKRFSEAAAEYRKAIKLYNGTAYPCHYSLANDLLNLNKINDAIQELDIAIKQNPYSGEAYALRGYCYQTLRNADKAITDMKKAVAYSYHCSWVFINLCDLLRRKNDINAALYYAKLGLRYDPTNSRLMSELNKPQKVISKIR